MFVLAGCLIQVNLVDLRAQGQQPQMVVAQNPTTETAKPGAAGGAWSPALTGARHPLYRLCKSDIVEIDFPFSPQYDQLLPVEPDGYIALKGVSRLYAEGLTIPELQLAIVHAYSGVLHEPEVTVVLKDFEKPYFVAGGEVGKPGKYELRSDTTVVEGLAIAGGLTPRAKHSQVVLFRRISEQTVEAHLMNVKSMLNSRELGEDAHLQPGDFLFVPQNLVSKIRQFMPASSLSLYANPTGF
jgi:polysaccharide biosynthesis/export protein